MKVLIVGSGGREHAMLSAVQKSPKVSEIFVAPGNAGTALMAKNIPIPAKNIDLLLAFARDNKIDLTLVGPELPLTLGIVDEFQKTGLKIFGPSKKASVIEGSKIFTKEFCRQFNIPTAGFASFDSAHDAKAHLKQQNRYPVVIKADGIAAGKGVVIAQNEIEAFQAIQDMMVYEKFGEAGRQIIIEDFLTGEEASFIVLTDGHHYISFPPSQDHKRIFKGDKGPNTGGMGAYAPAPVITDELAAKIRKKIIEPTLQGLSETGRPYVGFLYAGVMICNNEPSLIEYNARLGDPEAEIILPLLKTDFIELVEKTLEGRIENHEVAFIAESCVGVVLTSAGYPGEYRDGFAIEGLSASFDPEIEIFHAGTKNSGGKIVTNGGRVLVVTARANDLAQAIQKSYSAVKKISFEGMHCRSDIGAKGLKHIKSGKK